MVMFVVLLIAVVVIALIARAGTKARTGASGDRAWLAGGDEAASPTPKTRAQYAGDLAPAEASQPTGEEAESLLGEDAYETEGEDANETEDEHALTATTTDGWTFIAREDGVEILRTAFFGPGQFVAARVRRLPESDRWGLEVLEKEAIDADGGTCWPYGGWEFRSEGDARAALSLLERRVIRPPIDEHGDPRTFSEEDFERSRVFMEQPFPDSEPADEDVPRG